MTGIKRALATAKIRKVPHPMDAIMVGVTWTTRKLKSLDEGKGRRRSASIRREDEGKEERSGAHQLAMVETALALVRILRGLSSAG